MTTPCTGQACTHPVDLFESTDGTSSARIDTNAGIIHGVKVLGLDSKATGITIGLDPAEFGDAVYQPYSYSLDAVAIAAPLYEGVRVYIDHPEFRYKPDGERIPSQRDRKLSEVFGRLVNVRLGETGLFADLEYVQNHPLAPQIVELAEKYPELLALSHNAKGDPSLVNGKIVITEITDVRSVDIVGERPGTTNSLFESEPRNMADALGTPEAPVVGKTDEQVTDAKYGGDVAVHEDDPMMAPDQGAQVTEDAADGDPTPAADHFDSAFQKEITDIVSGDGSASEKGSKIVALLKQQEKIAGIRGTGGESAPEDVGGDLEETDPEPASEDDEDKKVTEAAPCDDGKKSMTETAPRVVEKIVEVVPNKSKLMTELLETVVIPCIDLCNAHSIPVRGATVSALCRTPSKRRKALVETLAESPTTRQAKPRSQGAAVGLAETSPNANKRPAAKAATSQGKKLLESSPDEIWATYTGTVR